MIKNLQPRYNILLKDDKTYPWIVIRNEPFPRVLSTRRFVRDGSQYFGPYASVYIQKEILEMLRGFISCGPAHSTWHLTKLQKGNTGSVSNIISATAKDLASDNKAKRSIAKVSAW